MRVGGLARLLRGSGLAGETAFDPGGRMDFLRRPATGGIEGKIPQSPEGSANRFAVSRTGPSADRGSISS